MPKSDQRKILGHPQCANALRIHAILEEIYGCAPGGRLTIELLEKQLGDEAALPDKWITGQCLIDAGLPPGPEIGRWIEQAYTAQLEGLADSPESLMKIVQTMIRNSAA